MYSVKGNISNELNIKNSRFITFIYSVNSIEEIDTYLSNLSNNYQDSTHICYAYILDSIKKYNDDNEPSNTAGLPILKVLEKNNLINVLVVVVRYFGGIKLGANGLIRAYTKSTTEVLNNNIIPIEKGYNIDMTFSYDFVKQIDYFLKNIKVLSKDYQELITYNLNVNNSTLELLKKMNIDIIINKEIYIEKEDIK